jgi:hypothetical protein
MILDVFTSHQTDANHTVSTEYSATALEGKHSLVTATAFHGMRFSPDGRSVLGNRNDKVGGKPVLVPLAVVSVADGTERRVPVPNAVIWVHHACWSPDGKQVAYHWHEEVPPAAQIPAKGNPPKVYASRITVADVDGRNANTIVRREGQDVKGLDWK